MNIEDNDYEGTKAFHYRKIDEKKLVNFEEEKLIKKMISVMKNPENLSSNDNITEDNIIWEIPQINLKYK